MHERGDVVADGERGTVEVPAVQLGDRVAPLGWTEEPLGVGHRDIQPRVTGQGMARTLADSRAGGWWSRSSEPRPTTAKPDRLDPERSDATDAMTSPNAETLISRRRFIHRDDGYSSVDAEVWRWVLAYALALPTG